MPKVFPKLVECWYCGETYDTNEDLACPHCFKTPEEELHQLKQNQKLHEEDSVESV